MAVQFQYKARAIAAQHKVSISESSDPGPTWGHLHAY